MRRRGGGRAEKGNFGHGRQEDMGGGPGDREVGRRGQVGLGSKKMRGVEKRPRNLDLSWHRHSSDVTPSKVLHGLPLKGGAYQH